MNLTGTAPIKEIVTYDNARGYQEHMMAILTIAIVTNTHASRRVTSLHWYMPQADVNTHLACTYL